jgi:hypothetical protein
VTTARFSTEKALLPEAVPAEGGGASQPSAPLFPLRRPSHLVGYVGEESPVEVVCFEEEKSSCSKRAILALLSCSSFKRFSLSSDSILSSLVRSSMS